MPYNLLLNNQIFSKNVEQKRRGLKVGLKRIEFEHNDIK